MIDIRNEIIWKDYNFLLDKLTKFEDEGYQISLTIATIAAPGFVTLYYYNNRRTVNDDAINGIVSELYYNGYKTNGFYYIISITNNEGVYQWEQMSKVWDMIKSRFSKADTHRGTGEIIIKRI